MSYRDLFKQVQGELPRNATPQERGEATRRAAAIWRGRRQGAVVRENPSGSELKRLALFGLLAYVGLQLLQRRQPQGG